MKAAIAKRVITPSTTMRMAGFDRRTTPAIGKLDDLYVSVLALESDKQQHFLLCSFDLLGVDRTLCKQIREALPLPSEQVWICATHTHSAPAAAFSGGISQNDEYIRFLVCACRDAADEAFSSLAPVSVYYREATADHIASFRDRSRDNSSCKMSLKSWFFQGTDKEINFTRFCCHPTILNEENLLYSRDLGGFADQHTLAVNGPCADLSTRFTRQSSTPVEVSRMCALLKTALETANNTLLTPDFGSCIHTHTKTIALPYGNSIKGNERETLYRELKAQAAICTDLSALRELDACMAVLERDERTLPTTRTVTISAADLGSCVLLGLPFEVGHADGIALEQAVSGQEHKPALLICYCNGYDGYLPRETCGIQYQDLASGYPPQARKIIWDTALACAANTHRNEVLHHE